MMSHPRFCKWLIQMGIRTCLSISLLIKFFCFDYAIGRMFVSKSSIDSYSKIIFKIWEKNLSSLKKHNLTSHKKFSKFFEITSKLPE